MATKPVQSAFVRAQFASKKRPKRPQFPPGTPLFMTWWLYGALPPLNQAGRDALQKLTGRERLVRIEKLLDAAKGGSMWLGDERVAAAVCDVIEKGDTEFHLYVLHAYVVMPNHLHLLATPTGDIGHLMGKVKGITARQANLILSRTGERFWDSWSFDHFSRDQENFAKMKNYIVMNPVWAKLASRPEDFRWSSAYRKLATTPIAAPVMASAKTA
jgi:putative transposase